MKVLTLAVIVFAVVWLMTPHTTMQERADAECNAVAAGTHAVNVGVYLNGHVMTHGTWCELSVSH